MADKNSFIVYLNYHEKFEDLTDSQYRQLWDAIFTYEKTHIVPKISDIIVKAYFNVVRVDLDGHRKEYEKTCAQNKRNIQERWNKRDTNDTTVYDRKEDIPPNTDDTTVYDGKEDIPPNTNDTTVYDGKEDIPPNTNDTTVYERKDVYDRIRNVPPDTNDTKRTDMIGHDMTGDDSEEEMNTTTTSAREGEEPPVVDNVDKELEKVVSKYTDRFGKPDASATVLLCEALQKYGYVVILGAMMTAGQRASPPDNPAAYIARVAADLADKSFVAGVGR